MTVKGSEETSRMLRFHDAVMGWQVELLCALEHFADGDLGKYQEHVGFADADFSVVLSFFGLCTGIPHGRWLCK